VSAAGTAFLAHLPANRNARHRGWRGLYGAWAETPVRADSPWKRDEKTARLDIRDYICAYGFCVDIDPAVAAQANAIINRPGSYYAYGRIGMIIISPRTRQVLYLYNG
jgi:hypothetical protein